MSTTLVAGGDAMNAVANIIPKSLPGSRTGPHAEPGNGTPAPGLLAQVLEATPATRPEAASALDRFLVESAPAEALRLWLGPLARRPGMTLRRLVVQRLGQDIAHIDQRLNRQVNAILHHPAVQKLEATWRGLHYLVGQAPQGENVKVRLLNVSWKDLVRDLDRALEFDQSQLFRKVYSDVFGTR